MFERVHLARRDRLFDEHRPTGLERLDVGESRGGARRTAVEVDHHFDFRSHRGAQGLHHTRDLVHLGQGRVIVGVRDENCLEGPIALGHDLVRALDQRRVDQPNKITTIFGHKVTKLHHGKLQTVIEHMDLANPVIRSHYRNGFIKQYVRDHLILRTEASTNNVTAYGVKKAVDNLPTLRSTLSAINDNYLNVQQDIVETFLDRGQLRNLAQPTITAAGKHIPGLKLDNRR